MADMEPIEFNDPQDVLVREYLSATLDGQTGRAEARFRQFLAEQQPPPARHRSFPLSNSFLGWTVGMIGAALAASLVVWAMAGYRAPSPNLPQPVVNPPIAVTPVNNPLLVEQEVQTQTFDDGTFMADDHTPVRILRRRDVEHTRWFDQNRKLQGEQVVPQDHLIYVHMRTD